MDASPVRTFIGKLSLCGYGGHCYWEHRASRVMVEAGKDVYVDGGVYSGSIRRKRSP